MSIEVTYNMIRQASARVLQKANFSVGSDVFICNEIEHELYDEFPLVQNRYSAVSEAVRDFMQETFKIDPRCGGAFLHYYLAGNPCMALYTDRSMTLKMNQFRVKMLEAIATDNKKEISHIATCIRKQYNSGTPCYGFYGKE
jgi:hypothetical protein